MEFLVRTENPLPADTPDQFRDQLRSGVRPASSSACGGYLAGLYEAEDPAALHDALVSLPMWKWMNVTVEALAAHPQERT